MSRFAQPYTPRAGSRVERAVQILNKKRAPMTAKELAMEIGDGMESSFVPGTLSAAVNHSIVVMLKDSAGAFYWIIADVTYSEEFEEVGNDKPGFKRTVRHVENPSVTPSSDALAAANIFRMKPGSTEAPKDDEQLRVESAPVALKSAFPASSDCLIKNATAKDVGIDIDAAHQRTPPTVPAIAPTPITTVLDSSVRPDHYRYGNRELIDILRELLTPEEFRGFCKGNVIKYTTRANRKGGPVDYKKAGAYAGYLTQEEKGATHD